MYIYICIYIYIHADPRYLRRHPEVRDSSKVSFSISVVAAVTNNECFGSKQCGLKQCGLKHNETYRGPDFLYSPFA